MFMNLITTLCHCLKHPPWKEGGCQQTQRSSDRIGRSSASKRSQAQKTSSWYLRAITLNANVTNLSTSSSTISRFPPPWPLDIGWTNPFSNSTVSSKFCWLSSSQRHAGLENFIFVVGLPGEFLLSVTLAKPFVLQQKAQFGGMDLVS